MTKLLYATTNPAKLEAMKGMLKSLPVELYGLNEIKAALPDVDESGASPLDNATIKAKAYYSVLKTPLFSCDSGLYINGLPDNEQPGVHVRGTGKRMSDDEMIEYYSGIARRLGGRAYARYRNAVCLIFSNDEIYAHEGEDISYNEFIIADKPHDRRVEGFPIDSLSIHIPTDKYYYELENRPEPEKRIDNGFCAFFAKSLRTN